MCLKEEEAFLEDRIGSEREKRDYPIWGFDMEKSKAPPLIPFVASDVHWTKYS